MSNSKDEVISGLVNKATALEKDLQRARDEAGKWAERWTKEYKLKNNVAAQMNAWRIEAAAKQERIEELEQVIRAMEDEVSE